MNILQRINEVRKKVDYVQKDKDVGGKYKAVTHDAITAAIRPALIANGIVIVPRLTGSAVVQTEQVTGKGIHFIRYEGRYEVDFVNMDEPADKLTVTLEAHALDDADKAPGKAASYATKYAMLKLFSIETGEDEEGRMHQPEGIPDEEYTLHLTALEAATDTVSLERAWKAAAAACREHKDTEAHARLKAVAAARGKKLKAAA